MDTKRRRFARTLVACFSLLAACSTLPELEPAHYIAPTPGVAWTPPAKEGLASLPVLNLPSVSAELAPDVRRLSLAQLVEEALRINPTTRQKWEQARAAAAAWAVARGAYYPELAARLSATDYDLGTGVGTTKFDGFQGVEKLSLKYLLFDFGGRRASAESAKQVLASANWNHDDAIQQVVRNVAQAFYAYLGSQAQLESAEANEASADKSLQAAEAQRKAGEGTIVAVMQAQASYQQSRADVASAGGSVKQARGELASAVGWPANTEFGVVESLKDLRTETLARDVDSFIEEARGKRSDLAAVRASVQQMEAELMQAKAARWPQVKLAADLGAEQISDRRVNSQHYNRRAQIMLDIPIFQGFQLENQVREARANLDASRAALELQEQQVISDVWSAYYDFQSTAAQVEAADAAVASASESFEGSLERYRDGVADIVELVQAQTTLAQSRSQAVTARTNLYTAYADLLYAIGEEPTP